MLALRWRFPGQAKKGKSLQSVEDDPKRTFDLSDLAWGSFYLVGLMMSASCPLYPR